MTKEPTKTAVEPDVPQTKNKFFNPIISITGRCDHELKIYDSKSQSVWVRSINAYEEVYVPISYQTNKSRIVSGVTYFKTNDAEKSMEIIAIRPRAAAVLTNLMLQLMEEDDDCFKGLTINVGFKYAKWGDVLQSYILTKEVA